MDLNIYHLCRLTLIFLFGISSPVSAGIFGEDDRFTKAQNTIEALDEVFDFVGITQWTKSECLTAATGFVAQNRLVISKHFIKGGNEDGCSIADLEFLLGDRVLQIENNMDFKNLNHSSGPDFLLLDLKNEIGKGLAIVQKTELRSWYTDVKNRMHKEEMCFQFGIKKNSDVVAASSVQFIKPFNITDRGLAYANCADTQHGASGGPLVCIISGTTRVIGVNSFQKIDYHDTCNNDNIFDVGNYADRIMPHDFE